jgi:hypothetical protein
MLFPKRKIISDTRREKPDFIYGNLEDVILGFVDHIESNKNNEVMKTLPFEESCVAHLKLPRRSGHTTAVLKAAAVIATDKKVLVIDSNLNMSEYSKKTARTLFRYFPTREYEDLSNNVKFYSACETKFKIRGHNYDVVFFNEASALESANKKLYEEIIRTVAPTRPTLILI